MGIRRAPGACPTSAKREVEIDGGGDARSLNVVESIPLFACRSPLAGPRLSSLHRAAMMRDHAVACKR